MTSPITGGAYALQRLQQLSHRLHHLRADVLADRDPEPLHQYRVCLRRLRSLLTQFAPALVLPAKVNSQRVALLARATGQVRDADVLRLRLEQDLLPALSEGQRQQGGQLLLERLAKRRRKAFVLLEAELLAPRTLHLLARLHDWQLQPRFTPLGQLPLRPWIREWLLALTGSCFLHAGWFAEQPEASDLHDLRKRLKAVRYGLELLQEPLGPAGAAWLQRLRRAQGCLGDLHDLAVLQQRLDEDLAPQCRNAAERLRTVIARDRQACWETWRLLRGELLDPACRRSLLDLDWAAD